MFESEEISERVYNSDEDDYVYKPKVNTKDIIKTKSKGVTQPENIYSKIKFKCKECHEEFRNKIALTTHSYSHNRKYLENTEDFDINSSQNERVLYYR